MSDEESLLRRSSEFLSRRLRSAPEIAIVLGSGLSEVDLGPERIRIPYPRVPGFPVPAVGGHSGVLTQHSHLVALRGRAHFYEGRSMDEIVRPVRVLARLGVRTLILTNASGAIHRLLRPGDLLLIRDHLNLMGVHPLRGRASFIDLSRTYDASLRKLARAAARRCRIRVREGVYAAMSGPAYETPAEIRMLRALGADAVGMSTVPEAIAAREAGMRVLGLSVVTNVGAGLRPVSHEEVLETAARARRRLEPLLREIVARLLPPGPS